MLIMEFKDILAEYLETHAMSQSEFARLIGVKQSQVSEWLKGKAKPGYDNLLHILQSTDEDAAFWFDLR